MEYLDNKINKSNFVISLITNSKNVYAKHMQTFIEDKITSDNFSSYGTDDELYKKKTFEKYNTLSSQLEYLTVIPSYFGCKEAMEAMKKLGVAEIDYYKYHFETFLVRIVSILDLCSKLGNQVYELGIKDKNCNWVKFTENLSNEDCTIHLINLKESLKDISKDRNIIIHQGNHQTKEIDSIDNQIFNLEMIEIDDLLQQWFDEKKDDKIAEVKIKMEEYIRNTIDLTFVFIESLKRKFEDRVNKN